MECKKFGSDLDHRPHVENIAYYQQNGGRCGLRPGYGIRKSSPPSSLLRVCPSDWTEKEVRELRRVERVFQLAGLATEISWGRSDEGDPWCVICRTGSIQVLAHFARIDGLYFGYSESLGCRRSDCLQDLSDDFLKLCSKPLILCTITGHAGTYSH